MLSESITGELRQLEARSLTLYSEFCSAIDECSDIQKRAEILSRSHSNSFFGDHAFTHYKSFEPPPSGFDVEWGHLYGYRTKHNEDWVVYSLEELLKYVYGDASFDEVEERNHGLDKAGVELRDRALDLFALIEDDTNGTLSKVASEVSKNISSIWKRSSAQKYVSNTLQKGPFMTRDTGNASQGMRTPVHVSALGQLHFLKETADALLIVANAARRVLLISELASPDRKDDKLRSGIFIGHGRSPLWRELQAYLEKELGLTTEEFNSEPVAGLSTQSRLDEMLQNTAMAFLVMTAEDQVADGTLRARENVIHEVGLFQGHLGWTKALVLLEEGCSEFSNLHGVNHLPFRKNSIKDAFVDVRRALAREGLVSK